MNEIASISLSIVSHADSEKISRLLNSLQKHEKNAKQFQIILTDNLKNELPEFNSTPWASLSIIRNKKPLGFAQNHNNAFKLATGMYFAILNPDLIFEEPIFDVLINTLQKHQLALIAPKIIDANGVLQDSFRELPTPLKLIKRRLVGEQIQPMRENAHELISPDWIAGMFWLMKSETYQKLNGMDEKFRLYFEDVDFCTRVKLSGLKIALHTKTKIRHDAQRSSRKKIYYLMLHAASALKFFASPVYWQAIKRK